MGKKCFLCDSDKGKVLEFDERTFNNCFFKLAYRKRENFKYNDVTLAENAQDFVGYHSPCYKKVTVLMKGYAEEFRSFVAEKYSKTHKESEVSVSAISEEEEETVHKVKVEYDDSFCYEEHNLETDEPQEKRMKIILAPKEPPKQKNDSNSNPLRNDSRQLLKVSRVPDSLGNTLLPPVIITKETLGESSRPLVNEGDKHFEGADKYKTKNLPQDVKLSPDSLNEPRIEDCFDNFGKYVAAMMKNMSVQRALELQPKIVEMLVSAVILDNQEDLNNQSDSEKS